jgi:hypothetical protein
LQKLPGPAWLGVADVCIALLRAAKPDARYHSRCSGDTIHTTLEDEIQV